jgi:hypothetical protein
MPAALKPKKKGDARAQSAAAKPTTPKMVVHTQSPASPLEEIYHVLHFLPILACAELTRRLLTSVSSLSTGAARPRSVVKAVLSFVAEYGSTP